MGRGIMTLRRSHVDGLGKAVDYGTLSTALASDVDVILGHLRLSASAQERAAMAEVVGYDIKASKKQKGFVPFDRVADAFRKKAIVKASPELARISSDLDPFYAELLQLTVPVVASSIHSLAAPSLLVQHPKEGSVAHAHTPSQQTHSDHDDSVGGLPNKIVDDVDQDELLTRRVQRNPDKALRTTGWLGRLHAAMVHSDAAEPGEEASDKPPSNSLDVTFVAPGMFDEPLDLFGASGGQHGRNLGSCVSVGCPGSHAEIGADIGAEIGAEIGPW